ncbi:MAG TPA: signal peptidase II [Gammaproteobacteria bacterium]|nr:signal peptidase II [Gammaproteobacteria bacterium]
MNIRAQAYRKLGWLWLSLCVVIVDQISKALVASQLHVFDSIRVLPVFNIVLLHNPGAAFSFLADQPGWQRWVFILLALAITAGIVIWIWRLPAVGSHWLGCALALVAGGAIGNVADRIWRGYVIDFIQLHYQQWFYPAFNVADSAITVGAAILILYGLTGSERRQPQ